MRKCYFQDDCVLRTVPHMINLNFVKKLEVVEITKTTWINAVIYSSG